MRLYVELSLKQYRLLLEGLSGARWRAVVHADTQRIREIEELSSMLRAARDAVAVDARAAGEACPDE